jgi:hypothetical protein
MQTGEGKPAVYNIRQTVPEKMTQKFNVKLS